MKQALFFAVAVFIPALSSAHAAVVSKTVTFGPSLTDFTNSTLTVAPFDTTLGTLSAVNLTLGATANVSGTVTNTSALARSFTVSTNTVVTLSSMSGTNIDGLTVLLNATQAFTNLTPNTTANYGPFMPSKTTTVAGTPLSAFTAGRITLVASTNSSFAVDGAGGNSRTTLSSTASGVLTVAYTYTAFGSGSQPASVPEPASMALLGAGLLAAGVIRKRV